MAFRKLFCCFSAQILDAFSLRNVAIEEESRITEEGRVTLSKMLAINTKLINLLDEHPFEFIVFPTHQLPMTVGCQRFFEDREELCYN